MENRIMATLFSWLGFQDIKAFRRRATMGGPVPSMLKTGNFDHTIILSNWKDRLKVKETDLTERECADAIDWFQSWSKTKITYQTVELEDPTDTAQVYQHSLNAIKEFQTQEDDEDFSFNLSSGTWAMAIAWSLIAKTQVKGRCLGSDAEKGPVEKHIPFDLKAELIPEITRREISKNRDPGVKSVMIESNEFYQKTTFQGEAMLRAHEDAILAANHAFPVLVTGDLGTEKSVIANLIHKKDLSRSGPFVRVFCGSDYSREIEQRLFGVRRQTANKKLIEDEPTESFFEKAEGGTLYLEDINTLNSIAQSLLLEKIEEAERARTKNTGGTDWFPRIVASSKTELMEAVKENRFSEQLFFKLSAVIIKVPNLSERGQDILTVANSMLEMINQIRASDTSYAPKRFTPSAENFIQNHKWQGNLLELEATVKRTVLSTQRESITEEDMFRSIISLPQKGQTVDEILNQPLGDELNLKDIITNVAKHYLIRAREQSGGNTSVAYKLLGLTNYQTFRNWYTKYVENDGK